MKLLYQGLLRIKRTVVRQAERVVARTRRRSQVAHLSMTVDLVRHVLAQTRARVLRGDTHYPGKVVSLFEPHTDIIRKGKLATPTEFGRLVKIQEAEAQFITDYEVCERGQAERALWAPALDRHIVLPRQHRETRSRAARAALRWRTGSEGRISALKRRHGLQRCRYRGASGMQRW